MRAGLQSATLRWDAVEGATGYTIVVQPTGGAVAPSGGTSNTAVTIGALEGGRVHAFRVVALRNGSEIVSSAVVSVAPIPVGHDGLAPRTVAAWSASDAGLGFRFGFPVAAAGDVNGDGFDDVLFGADQFSNPETQEGLAMLIAGGPAGLVDPFTWSFESNQANAHSGKGLASAGDVNGDGRPDVVVAAPDFDAGQSAEGRAWVFLGIAASTPAYETVASWTWDSDQPFAYTGRHVGSAGDVNGDGFDDVLVAVHGWDGPNGGNVTGEVHLFQGSAGGLPLKPSATLRAEEDDSAFGYASSATRGDIDGDGYDDVVVAAYKQGQTISRSDAGKLFLYRGGPLGLDTNAAWSYVGGTTGERTGVEVEIAGDVNGDGFDDIVAGADGVSAGTGRAILFLGSASGPKDMPDWSLDAAQPGAALGSDVAGAGDVNGDGFDDVIVGAYRYDGPATDSGRAWIHLGGPAGLSLTPSWEVNGAVAQAYFGGAVSSAGDVNGDGADDVIVGVQGFEGIPVPVGRAFLFLGAPAQGPDVTAGPSTEVEVGASFALARATFTDSTASAPFTCRIEWGDGSVDTLAPCDVDGLSSTSHAYTTAATRTLVVRVTNAFGIRGESATTITAR